MPQPVQSQEVPIAIPQLDDCDSNAFVRDGGADEEPGFDDTTDMEEVPVTDPGSLEDLARVQQQDEAESEVDVDDGFSAEGPTPSSDNDLGIEDLGVPPVLHIKELQIAQQFIDALAAASLDTSGLHPECLERLRKPPEKALDITDDSLRFSLEVYTHVDHASEAIYNSFRQAVARFPDNVQLMSLDRVKRHVQEISGLYPMLSDMCVNSCVGFVGAFAMLDKCPECNEPRYELLSLGAASPKPRKQFLTNPLGPQLQAAWRSPESARAMCYRKQCQAKILADLELSGAEIAEISDWVHGTEAIDANDSGNLNENSSAVMLSLDGAQLYRSKQSDCWIYIWILLDRSPDTRYKKKHVIIGGIIPGPTKPKNIDSFLFPGMFHLSALMREGLLIWDASTNRLFRSYPFLAYLTADGPGMQFINGLVGHSGRFGCRLYCPVKGRHKPGAGHYYPAHLKPDNYDVEGCNHDDISVRTLTVAGVSTSVDTDTASRYEHNLRKVQGSLNNTQYEKNRLETGIAKPSLVSGLPPHCIFGVPSCFPADIMHLVALNIPELLLGLWRGTLKCDKNDSKANWDWAVLQDSAVWKQHGKEVAASTPYLPGSFDRPPRNPAEKLTSGYKAVEFLHYIFGLAPALLYGLLPFKYWQNFCRLVKGVRLIYQRKITTAELQEAHKQLTLFVEEFEVLYYQRHPGRIHFIRQSIHALLHMAAETIRIGPYGIVAQWTMERAIGDLGGEVRQPSNPYANLAQRALRRCQINAVNHMLPALNDDDHSIPRGALDLGGGVLLRGQDDKARALSHCEAQAIQVFMRKVNFEQGSSWAAAPVITKWARLNLPNGQVVRSRWKEGLKEITQVRMSRNIKVRLLHRFVYLHVY